MASASNGRLAVPRWTSLTSEWLRRLPNPCFSLFGHRRARLRGPADQVGPGAEAQGADRGRRPHSTSESQTLDDVTAQPRPVALAGRGLEPDASKVGWLSAQLVELVDEVGGTSLHSMIN